MKNNSSKISQKRTSKKFKTTVKQSGPIFANKLRSSTTQVKNPIPLSAKGRKSAIVGTIKRDTKKSLTTKENNMFKKGKKSTTSLFKGDNVSNKDKKMSIKGRKSIKKSTQIDNKTKSKDNLQKGKDINVQNSEAFNSENNTNVINTEENSKLNDNRSKSNQEDEKPQSISSKNGIKEIKSKSQSKRSSKKGSLKENKIPFEDDLKKSQTRKELIDYNKHININLIKETNEKPNYRYDINYENNVENQEGRLRNYKIESSDYITDKNKFLIRNLLYLLDKKPDDKKGAKNYFRNTINALNNSQQNKILEMLAKTKKDIFRIKNEEKLNHIDSLYADKKMSDIYQTLFEPKYPRNRFKSLENYPQTQVYREKYFFNYVDGVHPNMYMILRNNNPNAYIPNLKQSSEKKYQIMGKNKLMIENRDDRYLRCNYDFMMNNIDNKLNNDYREIYRRKRMQHMLDDINWDIYEMNPYQENMFRKTYSDIKRNPLYL